MTNRQLDAVAVALLALSAFLLTWAYQHKGEK